MSEDLKPGGNYTCDQCGGTFTTGWSEEEAEAEAERLFGIRGASSSNLMARVCDDCFTEIMNRAARAREVYGSDGLDAAMRDLHATVRLQHLHERVDLIRDQGPSTHLP